MMDEQATHHRGKAKRSIPKVVRLLADHGFIEEVHNKGVFHWKAGEEVTNPATVALLVKRGAALEVIDD